jgi:hypothetical protein
MPQKDIEIEISSEGEVKVHFKGIKGKRCLEYAKLFERAVGKSKTQELTSEFYEPDSQVGIDISQEIK